MSNVQDILDMELEMESLSEEIFELQRNDPTNIDDYNEMAFRQNHLMFLIGLELGVDIRLNRTTT